MNIRCARKHFSSHEACDHIITDRDNGNQFHACRYSCDDCSLARELAKSARERAAVAAPAVAAAEAIINTAPSAVRRTPAARVNCIDCGEYRPGYTIRGESFCYRCRRSGNGNY